MDNHQAQHGEAPRCSPIVELRQYTLHPGQRDVLITLFEREFIESQEAVGITLIGQFRDLSNPDRFVWLRGFPDMEARKASLQAFYGGPAWQEHRNTANATMVDSDNVLLLCQVGSASGFSLDMTQRPPRGATELPSGLVVATILSFEEPLGADALADFEQALIPSLTRNGASVLAYFVTEESANTFPILPVREGEHVFVWFSLFRDQAHFDRHAAALAQAQDWQQIWEPVRRRLTAAPEIVRLAPTARSLVHG